MDYCDKVASVATFSNEDNQDILNLSDGKLLTEDGYMFNIHRYVLAMRSWYFRVVFSKVDINKTYILIPGIKGEILQEVLSYIYTNEINFRQENIAEVLLTSDYLLLEDLSRRCEIYASYNTCSKNCLQLFSTAFLLNLRKLYRHSLRLLRIYFEEVVSNTNADYETIPAYPLKRLLCCENLKGREEGLVWKVIVRWVESDKSYRQMFVPDLLLCLKIGNINENLATTIVEHEIVKTNPWLKELTEMKATNSSNTNLEVLRSYVHSEYITRPEITNYQEMPSKLYIIHIDAFLGVTGVLQLDRGLYVTYDENINIWRKLTECDNFNYITSIRESIYCCFFGINYLPLSFKHFNLVQKKWTEINYPIEVSDVSHIVKHQDLIYFLGCSSDFASGYERSFVYSPILNSWNEIAPMTPPVYINSAASFGGKIYVAGSSPLSKRECIIIIQKYDPLSNMWSKFPFNYNKGFCPPDIIPVSDKLYFIFETLHVIPKVPRYLTAMVYDRIKRVWEVLPDPPPTVYINEAINFNDELVLYDFIFHRHAHLLQQKPPRRPLRWNEYTHQWESLEEQFSAIQDYNIFVIEDKNSIGILTEENRRLHAAFGNSPFN